MVKVYNLSKVQRLNDIKTSNVQESVKSDVISDFHPSTSPFKLSYNHHLDYFKANRLLNNSLTFKAGDKVKADNPKFNHYIIDSAALAAGLTSATIGEGAITPIETLTTAGIQALMIAALAKKYNIDPLSTGVFMARELYKSHIIVANGTRAVSSGLGLLAHGTLGISSGGVAFAPISATVRAINGSVSGFSTLGVGNNFIWEKNNHKLKLKNQLIESSLYLGVIGLIKVASHTDDAFIPENIKKAPAIGESMLALYSAAHECGADTYSANFMASFASNFSEAYIDKGKELNKDELLRVAMKSFMSSTAYALCDESMTIGADNDVNAKIEDINDYFKKHPDFANSIESELMKTELGELSTHSRAVLNKFKDSTTLKALTAVINKEIEKYYKVEGKIMKGNHYGSAEDNLEYYKKQYTESQKKLNKKDDAIENMKKDYSNKIVDLENYNVALFKETKGLCVELKKSLKKENLSGSDITKKLMDLTKEQRDSRKKQALSLIPYVTEHEETLNSDEIRTQNNYFRSKIRQQVSLDPTLTPQLIRLNKEKEINKQIQERIAFDEVEDEKEKLLIENEILRNELTDIIDISSVF